MPLEHWHYNNQELFFCVRALTRIYFLTTDESNLIKDTYLSPIHPSRCDRERVDDALRVLLHALEPPLVAHLRARRFIHGGRGTEVPATQETFTESEQSHWT